MNDEISPELQPLLDVARNEIGRESPDLKLTRSALEHIFEFLCSTEGRTHANCVATNMFFLLPERWPCVPPPGWEHLPEEYALILDDAAGCLHDTIEAPEIAHNFESTPEQLLQRTRALLV
jgi:hypothetical protein